MVLLKLDESCTAFQIFSSSIRADKTRITYKEGLNHFMRFNDIKAYMDLKNADTDTIQDWLERWVIDQKNKGLKHFTIAGRLHGVELFLDMNKKIWYKRIVRKLMPSNDHIPGGEVPFTTEELYQMLLACKKPRDAALMHFIASTGVRPLAFEDPVLRMKHLEKIEDCYTIKVYDGSKEGYPVFLTPEASKALDTYIKSRKLNGEQITDESPIFANYPNGRLVKHDYLSAYTIRGILEKLFKTAGIERKKQGRRYDKSIVYGFRKRFNGILKMNNLVNPNIAEKLMAHKRGLDNTYLKPTREQCFAEFKKAIPELTIDGSERLKLKYQKSESEKSELIHKTEKIDELGKRLEESEKEIQEIKYGPNGRQARFAKFMLNSEITQEWKIFGKALTLLFEFGLPEEKKRAMMKELEQAAIENRKPDLHAVFGTHKLTEEQKNQLQESLRNYGEESNTPKITSKFRPRFRIENLEMILAE